MAKSHLKPVPKPYLDDDAQKRFADRLARIEGHVRSLRTMVLAQRCADEILLQVSAVRAALNQVAAGLLEHELKACVDSCMSGGRDERLEKVSKVLAMLLKQT